MHIFVRNICVRNKMLLHVHCVPPQSQQGIASHPIFGGGGGARPVGDALEAAYEHASQRPRAEARAGGVAVRKHGNRRTSDPTFNVAANDVSDPGGKGAMGGSSGDSVIYGGIVFNRPGFGSVGMTRAEWKERQLDGNGHAGGVGGGSGTRDGSSMSRQERYAYLRAHGDASPVRRSLLEAEKPTTSLSSSSSSSSSSGPVFVASAREQSGPVFVASAREHRGRGSAATGRFNPRRDARGGDDASGADDDDEVSSEAESKDATGSSASEGKTGAPAAAAVVAAASANIERSRFYKPSPYASARQRNPSAGWSRLPDRATRPTHMPSIPSTPAPTVKRKRAVHEVILLSKVMPVPELSPPPLPFFPVSINPRVKYMKTARFFR